jgi:hypothetical protein
VLVVPPSLRYLVQTHTLGQLTLNGRPALPDALLAQLARAEASAPELLQFFSSAFLSLSDTLLAPVPSRASASGAPAALSASLEPAYALGFMALLRALHRQLPTLLTEPADLVSLCSPRVTLRGLLRERLAEGVPPIATALAAVRRLYATLLSEGALASPAAADEKALQYTLVVTPEGDVLVAWSLRGALGGGALGGQPLSALRVGLPVRFRGEVRLRPDPQTAAVREVWVKSLSINERPLLPKLLEQWVQQGRGRPAASGDVARDVRAVVAALLPWLSRPGDT